MKRAAIALLLLLGGCASSNVDDPNRPDVEFIQVYGPSDLTPARGANTMQIEYAVRIGNRSADDITLRRISVMSVGEGAYQLRPEEQTYSATIPPDTLVTVKLTARGYYVSNSVGDVSKEPVTVRAILFFDSPRGSFRRIVNQNLGQFRSAQ